MKVTDCAVGDEAPPPPETGGDVAVVEGDGVGDGVVVGDTEGVDEGAVEAEGDGVGDGVVVGDTEGVDEGAVEAEGDGVATDVGLGLIFIIGTKVAGLFRVGNNAAIIKVFWMTIFLELTNV